MTAEEFLARIVDPRRSVQLLMQDGCSKEVAEELASNRVALPKRPIAARRYMDPLLDLLDRFDTGTLQIGLVSFDQSVLSQYAPLLAEVRRVPVAMLEVDPIVIDRNTNEIIQLDWQNLDFTMARWAVNSDRFLEALVKVTQFEQPIASGDYSDHTWRPSAAEKNMIISSAREWAAKCALAAGLQSTEAGAYEGILVPEW